MLLDIGDGKTLYIFDYNEYYVKRSAIEFQMSQIYSTDLQILRSIILMLPWLHPRTVLRFVNLYTV